MTKLRHCLPWLPALLLTLTPATAGLSQPELDATSLDRLRDIVAPPPAPWWPPATGWRLVAAFVVIGWVAITILGLMRWQRERHRRAARAELVLLKTRLQEHDPIACAAAMTALGELLKRVAHPRPEMHVATGAAWFRFLDHGANEPPFAPGLEAVLKRSPEEPRVAARRDRNSFRDLLRAVRRWLDHHAPMGRDRRRP